VLELFGLAVVSAFWPTLVLVDVLAFQTAKPERVLVAFLAGGLVTTLTIGSLIIFELRRSELVTTSRSTTDPVLNIVIGLLAFAVAWVLARRARRPLQSKRDDAKESVRLERAIRRGAPIAFVAGLVINIVPGVFPFIALKDIAELDYSVAATFGVLLTFYLIMFAFIEVPIAGYMFAPELTQARVNEFNAWLGANGLRVAIWALMIGGAYFVALGVAQLV
jgi:hypothetical protein